MEAVCGKNEICPLYRKEFVYDFSPHLLANELELIVSSSSLQEMTLRSSSLQWMFALDAVRSRPKRKCDYFNTKLNLFFTNWNKKE